MIGSERAALLPAGAVALSAALWGLWWLPLRALADAGLSGAAVNAALYGIATLALLPWFWRRRRRLAAGGLLLLGAGGLFGGALVSWNLALILGEVVRVTLLFYLAPVWATLLGIGAARRAGRAPARGLGRARARGRGRAARAGQRPAAAALGRRLARSRRRPAVRALGHAGAQGRRRSRASSRPWCRSPTAALLSLLLLALAPPGAPFGPAVLAWAALAALAWLLPVTWLLLWGARFLEPGRVSLLLLFEVAVAATSAALLAGEPFGPREALGCLLILCRRRARRLRRAPPRPPPSRPRCRRTLPPLSRTSAAGMIE